MIDSQSTSDQGVGLKIDSLTKSFGGNPVLHGLSLEVSKGDLLSLLGPSGCGKSTTLNMIAGFEEPDSGSVHLDGIDITSRPPNRRDTAIVFQNYALFPHMVVYENVAYGLKARRLPKHEIQERVGAMLDLLNISELSNRYPGQLSGGQQQRVSLARAIAVRPSLLLLDEPLSNLDAKLREDVRQEIRSLQRELGQTAVFVTHDQEEALAVSDYVAVLNRGWLEQMDTPEALWKRPKTVYVADFMGVKNLLGVEVSGGQLRLTDGGVNVGETVPVANKGVSHIGLRPSDLSIADESSSGVSDALTLECVVISKTYLGTDFRYVCDMGGESGGNLFIDQDAGAFQADVGKSISVRIEANKILPLAESPAVEEDRVLAQR